MNAVFIRSASSIIAFGNYLKCPPIVAWIPETLVKNVENTKNGRRSALEEVAVIAETDRLILRRYMESDLQDLYEYLSNPEVVKYEPYKPMNMDEVRHNLEWRISTDEMVAVERKDNHKMIGNVYLGKRDFESLEIGYVFNQDDWGKGYAKESCLALVERAFSHGVHRIFAECDPQNQSSWKLLESLGFEKEAHLKQNVYFWKDNENRPLWKDTCIYAKLKKQV